MAAEVDGKVVGIVEGYIPPNIRPRLLWITWIVVDKRYRRRHVGSALISGLEMGVGIKWQMVQCGVRASNSASNSMFRGLGYKKVGVIKHPDSVNSYRWEKLLQPHHKRGRVNA